MDGSGRALTLLFLRGGLLVLGVLPLNAHQGLRLSTEAEHFGVFRVVLVHPRSDLVVVVPSLLAVTEMPVSHREQPIFIDMDEAVLACLFQCRDALFPAAGPEMSDRKDKVVIPLFRLQLDGSLRQDNRSRRSGTGRPLLPHQKPCQDMGKI